MVSKIYVVNFVFVLIAISPFINCLPSPIVPFHQKEGSCENVCIHLYENGNEHVIFVYQGGPKQTVIFK